MKASSKLHQVSFAAFLTYVALLCGGMALLAAAMNHQGILVHCSKRESLLLLSFFGVCCSLAATAGAFVGELTAGRRGRILGAGLGGCVGFVVTFLLLALLHE